jgi:beta-lactamase class A
MGPAPRLRPMPPARPVHAGRLAGWERLAFALVFALMMAFVVVITISSARAHGRGGAGVSAGSPSSAARPRLRPAARPRSGAGSGAGAGSGPAAPGQAAGRAARAAWDHRLAVALAPVVQGRPGSLAVGVIDAATGAAAVYGRRLRFQAASIVKPEILAALLLRARHAPAGLSNSDAGLAAQMIEASDRVAANRLWDLAGRAGGLAAADVVLGLRHTTPGPGENWGLTTTTVGDQLTLLADLTTAKSPLSSAERAYELSLMRAVGPAQRWGVSAAAGPGGVLAIKNGWRLDGPARLWVVNSIGVVRRDGHRLLLAVLSRGQPTRAAGIAAADAAAVAAAGCMTSGG